MTFTPKNGKTATPKPAFPAVESTRIIHAPPATVYRAWLDEDLVCQWLAPGDSRVLKVEIDERIGGRYRIYQGDDEGVTGGFDAKILEMEPGKRLVFDWGFVGPDHHKGPKFDSRLTLEFAPAPGGATKLRLLHEKLDDLYAAMPEAAELVGVGWEDVLKKLDDTLTTEGSA